MNQESKYPVPHRLQRWDAALPKWPVPLFWTVVLMLWEGAARSGWIPEIYLPGPLAILMEMVRLFTDGVLWTALGASSLRWGIGVAGGTVIGLTLALGAGMMRHARVVLESVVHFLYPIPKIAMLPLFILWMGIGETPKWVIIGMGMFFPVFINTLTGIARIPRIYYEVAAVYPTSSARFLRQVMLPAVWPAVFAGLRLGTGTALVLLVAAEMIAAETGLGALILHYGDLMLTTSLLACVILLSAIGLGIQGLLHLLERVVVPWK